MSFDYRKVLNLHLKYIDYLLEKTYFSHQDTRNIKLSGDEVENEIRIFFQNLIPERFKVTHGYILHAPDDISEPRISKQVDLILVDTLVTNRVFTLDKASGMEIIPVEAVVGVFEIKRTLDRNTLESAVNYLEEIISSVSIIKSDATHYLPGGIPLRGLTSGIHSNPLIGIISLDHKRDDFPSTDGIAKNIFTQANKVGLDLMASFSGLLVCPVENSQGFANFVVKNISDDAERLYGYINHSAVSRIAVLSRLIGYVCAYLNNCTGKKINARNYFFNMTTWEVLNLTGEGTNK